MMWKMWGLACLAPVALFSGSVRLVNNSPYQLRAVIRGADGSYLSEMVIQAQKEMVWTDSYGQSGTRASGKQPDRSKTPYTVLWYCMGGTDYAVCDTVGSGAVVTAQGCLGTRMCKPVQKKGQKTSPSEETIDQSAPEEATPKSGS